MILTRQLFRDTKTALMNIPGHPGSARLGEALARGFGFDDHHHAKTTFDAEEAALDWLPRPAEFNEVPFMDFLDDTPDQVKADMAATALFLVFGGLPFEDIPNYPVLGAGRVCLTGVVPEAWRTAAAGYLETAFGVFNDKTMIYMPRPGHWTYIEDGDGGEGLDEANYEMIVDGEQMDFDPDTWDAMDALDSTDNGLPDFQVFCDTAFLRVRDAIPPDLRRSVRHMAVDATGIRLVVATGSDATTGPASIWFVMV